MDAFACAVIGAFSGVPVPTDFNTFVTSTSATTLPTVSTRSILSFGRLVVDHAGVEIGSFELTKDMQVVEEVLSGVPDEGLDGAVAVDDIVGEIGASLEEEAFDVFGVSIQLGSPCGEHEIDAFCEIVPDLIPLIGVVDSISIELLGHLVEVNVVAL
jgi:hypothetical protein